MLRRYWRPLAIALVVVLAVGAAAVTVAAVFFGSGAAWFIAGGVYVALLGAWLVMFELIDPVSRRWVRGADGEAFTAQQLRRLRRRGWRAVHNIALESGDIDHLAIGPGGVLALETKSTDADWSWLAGRDEPRGWAKQAKDSAFRARWLIRQHTGLDVSVEPLVVAWTQGLADLGVVHVDGVRVVHGSALAHSLVGYDAVLSTDAVRTIKDALEPVAIQLEVHRARRRPAAA